MTFRPGGASSRWTPRRSSGATVQLMVVDVRDAGRPGLRARVLEWTGAAASAPLYDTRGRYLRVIRVGAEHWLLEQDAGENEPFEPDIRRLVWDGHRSATRSTSASRGASASTASP